MVHRISLSKLYHRAVSGWITWQNFSNTVPPVSGNTGLLIHWNRLYRYFYNFSKIGKKSKMRSFRFFVHLAVHVANGYSYLWQVLYWLRYGRRNNETEYRERIKEVCSAPLLFSSTPQSATPPHRSQISYTTSYNLLPQSAAIQRPFGKCVQIPQLPDHRYHLQLLSEWQDKLRRWH